ncbi:EF-hand domain-containing protein [Roseovarius sp. MBR-6]|uniref:EF-hand domain-containing protein n=1 Tax=Roseovarius sp. MBR-6 TaxID=3156459 RepID=UPI003396F016
MKKTVLMTGLAMAIGLGALSEVRAQGTEQGAREGMMGQGMMGMGDMATRFEGADTDGDGQLSRDEIVARMTERATAQVATRADRMIEHHDGDGDGMVSIEELQAGPMSRMFERLDADGDGAISSEEFAKMREMRQMMQGGQHGMGGHGKGGYGDGMRSHHGKGDRQGGYRGHGMGQGEQGPVIHHHYYYNR